VFRFFGFLVYIYLTLEAKTAKVKYRYTRKPKNLNMIAKTAKVKYMYTRKQMNLNMTGQNS
jgi:hypothetical protein